MDTSSAQQWADAMLEQVSDTLRKTEILAGASVAPERTTQIVETEMRRLFQALLKLPRGVDKATHREALDAMQHSIEAVRALTYNETSDGNNDTLRFVRMREHEAQANAAFERLTTLMQARVPDGVESEVDGTFFLLDIASKPTDATSQSDPDRSLPRGDYRAAFQRGNYEAVFDITTDEIQAVSKSMRKYNASNRARQPPPAAAVAVTIDDDKLVDKFDIARAFGPGLKNRTDLLRSVVPLQPSDAVLVTQTAAKPTAAAAAEETTALSPREATYEAQALLRLFSQARNRRQSSSSTNGGNNNNNKVLKSRVKANGSVDDDGGDEGVAAVAVIRDDNDDSSFGGLQAFTSVADAYSRGGGNFVVGAYNVIKYILLQESDAVARELNAKRKMVEQDISIFYVTDMLSTQQRALLAVTLTQNTIASLRRGLTTTEYEHDALLRAYESRLQRYESLLAAQKFADVVDAHLGYLRYAQARITQEIDQHVLSIEEKLDRLAVRLRFEKQEQQRQRDAAAARAEKDAQARLAEQTRRVDEENALRDAATQRNTLVIDTTTDRLQEVRNTSSGVLLVSQPPAVVESKRDEVLPPLVDLPNSAHENARINDLPLWHKGFRGSLPPWEVREFFASSTVAPDEKILRIGQLYVYVQSVGTLYRGGGDQQLFQPAAGGDEQLLLEVTTFADHVAQAHRKALAASTTTTTTTDYIEIYNLLGRFNAAQVGGVDALDGEQLNVLPKESVERRNALLYIDAFIEQSVQQRLDNAFMIGPVLSNMRLDDTTLAEMSRRLLDGGELDVNNSLIRAQALFNANSATLLEIARGYMNALARPVQETKRHVQDALYRAALGNDEHLVLYTDCDAAMIDKSLVGKRARVSYYQAPDDVAAQTRIDEMMRELTNETEPYKVHWLVQDTELGASSSDAPASSSSSSSLVVQSRQKIKWSETSRAMMRDLQNRATIVVTISTPGESLVEEVLRLPMISETARTAAEQTELPPPLFGARVSALAYIGNAEQKIDVADIELFLNTTMEYMGTERLPPALDVGSAEQRAAAMRDAAARLVAAEQTYVARTFAYLTTGAAGIVNNEARAIYGEAYATTSVDHAIKIYLLLRIATKMLTVVATLLGFFRVSARGVAKCRRAVVSCASAVGARYANSTASTVVRYVAKSLALDGVKDTGVWAQIATTSRSIGTGILGAYYDDIVMTNLLKIGDALRYVGGTGAAMSSVLITAAFRGVKAGFEMIAGLVSAASIALASAGNLVGRVARVQNYIDIAAMLFVTYSACAIVRGGSAAFAAELTHQMLSGFITLNAYRGVKYLADAALRRSGLVGSVAEDFVGASWLLGITAVTVAPWVLGTEFPIYGYLVPLVTGGYIDVTQRTRTVTLSEGAPRVNGALYLATAGIRTASTAIVNYTSSQRFRDNRDLPLQAFFRGAKSLTEAKVYEIFTAGQQLLAARDEAYTRRRLVTPPIPRDAVPLTEMLTRLAAERDVAARSVDDPQRRARQRFESPRPRPGTGGSSSSSSSSSSSDDYDDNTAVRIERNPPPLVPAPPPPPPAVLVSSPPPSSSQSTTWREQFNVLVPTLVSLVYVSAPNDDRVQKDNARVAALLRVPAYRDYVRIAENLKRFLAVQPAVLSQLSVFARNPRFAGVEPVGVFLAAISAYMRVPTRGTSDDALAAVALVGTQHAAMQYNAEDFVSDFAPTAKEIREFLLKK